MNELSRLTDSQLYKRCKEYGLNAKQWMRKFAGLLPEVYRRRLYKRRKYASIHEFAAKLAGMNHATVDRILRLSEILQDKPRLKEQFESGAQSWSKIEKVAYVAKPENEAEWAEKVRTIPQNALVLCVQEARKQEAKSGQSKIILQETKSEIASSGESDRFKITACGNFEPVKMDGKKLASEDQTIFSIKISPQTAFRFRKVKQQLERMKGEAMSLGEVLEELMKSYQGKEEKMEKKSVIQVCPECVKKKFAEKQAHSRNITVSVKRLVIERQKGKCAFPNCYHPPEIFHHTRRFVLFKSHDPDNIVYLCKKHEQIAHANLIENETQDPSTWKIRKSPNDDYWRRIIDRKVESYRKEPERDPWISIIPSR